ncbi:hypothetical protein XFF6166_410041 [Xanthomonas citri pv. fuscans]|nr:hypothetical protein XFF6166_410041 [Xanthomonas citri pv. fuscans]SOO00381.1 hypothetical protein XFF6960_300018 [Xanthomonas citri pv. fuscans]SOO07043.1 hypothetical protein XFF7767_90019 [Xanthomonas citri pv. fuscans]SOO13857.1 hypothetical protein XFF7766_250018 [Xanthomonas citri pv. fuscans]SOO41782.1 hypothetical protein XFF1815_100019 [Xanthomonas citri pv. fuscans]
MRLRRYCTPNWPSDCAAWAMPCAWPASCASKACCRRRSASGADNDPSSAPTSLGSGSSVSGQRLAPPRHAASSWVYCAGVTRMRAYATRSLRRSGRVIACIAAAGSALAPGSAGAVWLRWQPLTHSAASSSHAAEWNRPARAVGSDMRTMFPLIDRRILLSGCIGGKAGLNRAPGYGAQMLRFRSSWHVVDQCPTLAADVLFGQTCPASGLQPLRHLRLTSCCGASCKRLQFLLACAASRLGVTIRWG